MRPAFRKKNMASNENPLRKEPKVKLKTKSPRDLTKTIVGLIAQYGTGTIVYALIKNNVDDSRLDHKVGVGVASVAIGGIAKDAVKARTDEMIDDIFDGFKTVKDVTKDQK